MNGDFQTCPNPKHLPQPRPKRSVPRAELDTKPEGPLSPWAHRSHSPTPAPWSHGAPAAGCPGVHTALPVLRIKPERTFFQGACLPTPHARAGRRGAGRPERPWLTAFRVPQSPAAVCRRHLRSKVEAGRVCGPQPSWSLALWHPRPVGVRQGTVTAAGVSPSLRYRL